MSIINTFDGHPVLNTLVCAAVTVENSLKWVYSKLPPLYTHAKNAACSVRQTVRILYSPTLTVIEKIKEKFPLIDLTQALSKPPENQHFALKLLQQLAKEHAFIPNQIIKVVPPPALPPLKDTMITKKYFRLVQRQIDLQKQEFQLEQNGQGIVGYAIDRIGLFQEKQKLQRSKNQYREDIQQSLSESALTSTPPTKPVLGKMERMLHKIIGILLTKISSERNLGNLFSLILQESTKVLIALREIDLAHSTNIEEDFIKRLTRNINIDTQQFKKQQSEDVIKNLDKIASKIKKEYQNGKTSFITFASFLTPLFIKIIPSLTETISQTILKKICDLLKECNGFEECENLKDILKVYQEMIKNGIQCGSWNIQFLKAPNQCLSEDAILKNFEKNIKILIPLVIYTFITLFTDGLANYIDWDSNASPTSQAIQNQEKEVMQRDLKKNFACFIDEIQSTFNRVLSHTMGGTVELHTQTLEASELIFFSYFSLAIFSLLFQVNIGAELLTIGRADTDETANHIEIIRAVISSAARGSISMAAKLASSEVKRIEIAELIPVIAKYLGDIAKT
jgi:hypothetical protein